MLIEFSVQNYRSFYNKVSFSMEASPIREHESHIMEISGQRILKTSAVYGANASGKSNLFKAFAFMRNMVLSSSKESVLDEEIRVEPFLLNSKGLDEPTMMEAVFLIDGTLFRYGFMCTSKRVEKEWLYSKSTKPRSRELKMFYRDENKEFESHYRFKEGKESLKQFLKENTLLLSLLAQFNGDISSKITRFFLNTSFWNIGSYMPLHTSFLLQNGIVPQSWVQDFLLKADMGINGFDISEEEVSIKGLNASAGPLKVEEKKLIGLLIKTEHEYYDPDANQFKTVHFDLHKQESEGTKQFFSLAGLIYQSLENGNCLFLDELERSLHPILSRIIIQLFQDEETNPKGAQLIFTTHDTTLMNKSFFRRDELWFTAKDSSNSTELYSLVEYKLEKGKARNDSSYGKDYLRGKYGALPFVEYEEFAELFGKRQGGGNDGENTKEN